MTIRLLIFQASYFSLFEWPIPLHEFLANKKQKDTNNYTQSFQYNGSMIGMRIWTIAMTMVIN